MMLWRREIVDVETLLSPRAELMLFLVHMKPRSALPSTNMIGEIDNAGHDARGGCLARF